MEVLERRQLLAAVTDVFVNGTAWTQPFRDFLGSSGQGDATHGYRLDAASHVNELPWTNLNQVSIRFNEGVNVAADDLDIGGVNVAAYSLGAFAYDASTFTATWTLPTGTFNRDKLLLVLDADAGTGVSDAGGVALDGEWTNPVAPAEGGADAFPSGDGAPGGDFLLRLNALPGDADRSGGVDAADVDLVHAAQNSPAGASGSLYTIFKDVNGSGSIFGSDVTLVRNRQGTALPAGEPVRPPPTVTATGFNVVDEGSVYSLTLSTSDPAGTTGWLIDWGDGSDPDGDNVVGEILPGGATSATHVYADGDASHAITASATANGANVPAQAPVIAVNNVPPLLQALPARTFNVGDRVLLSALFTDPGAADTHTASIDWGDTTTVTGTVDATRRAIAASRVFTAEGVYTITITVTDDDQESDSASFTATVTSVAPTAPTGLTVSGTAWIDGVTITWLDNASDEDGYLVEWSNGGEWRVVGALPAGTTGNISGTGPIISRRE